MCVILRHHESSTSLFTRWPPKIGLLTETWPFQLNARRWASVVFRQIVQMCIYVIQGQNATPNVNAPRVGLHQKTYTGIQHILDSLIHLVATLFYILFDLVNLRLSSLFYMVEMLLPIYQQGEANHFAYFLCHYHTWIKMRWGLWLVHSMD